MHHLHRTSHGHRSGDSFGGTKGQRASLPNASIVLHQPRSGAQGQATDIQIRAKEVLHNKRAMLEILSRTPADPSKS